MRYRSLARERHLDLHVILFRQISVDAGSSFPGAFSPVREGNDDVRRSSVASVLIVVNSPDIVRFDLNLVRRKLIFPLLVGEVFGSPTLSLPRLPFRAFSFGAVFRLGRHRRLYLDHRMNAFLLGPRVGVADVRDACKVEAKLHYRLYPL